MFSIILKVAISMNFHSKNTIVFFTFNQRILYYYVNEIIYELEVCTIHIIYTCQFNIKLNILNKWDIIQSIFSTKIKFN